MSNGLAKRKKKVARARLSASPDVEVPSLCLHVVKRLVLQRLVEFPHPPVEVPDCSLARPYPLNVFQGGPPEGPPPLLSDRPPSLILPPHRDAEDLPPAG